MTQDNPLSPDGIDWPVDFAETPEQPDLFEVVEIMLRHIEKHGVMRSDERVVDLVHQALLVRQSKDWRVWVLCNKCQKNFPTVTYEILKKDPLQVAQYLVRLHRTNNVADFYYCRACGGFNFDSFANMQT
jgi:hypothetical protein